jgi:outer membrane protein
VESIPLDPIADLQPENVYNLALTNQPLQQYNAFKLKAAEKTTASAKGLMYPTLGAFGSLGSGYNNQARQVIGSSIVNTTVGSVSVNGTNYDVFAPYPKFSYGKRSFDGQLSDNFRQSIGLSLSVPIFNGGSLRTNYEKTKLNIQTLELQKKLDDQTLKQNIYNAYNSAVVAMEKFNASKKSVIASEQTYEFAGKRLAVGMLSTYDMITSQNNLFRAKLEYTINQFDYVFKMKVLEFYKGQGLKL